MSSDPRKIENVHLRLSEAELQTLLAGMLAWERLVKENMSKVEGLSAQHVAQFNELHFGPDFKALVDKINSAYAGAVAARRADLSACELPPNRNV